MSENRINEWQALVYLCGCAVKGEKPDPARMHDVSLDTLYQMAQKHLVVSAVGMALEDAGIHDKQFIQAVAAAQRKNALLDADRTAVLAGMEKAGIWYMPLKGSVLKDLYPRFGMRQMADNDILFDASRAKDVRKLMESMGFITKHFDRGNHDVYHKAPVSNFEMHRSLFGEGHKEKMVGYYQHIKERLIKDDGNQYGYHFSPEDFYLYFVAHEYKHYSGGGTGLRSLLDIYVYLKKVRLDESYIAGETEKLGIRDFEKTNRSLALHLFDGINPNEEEQEMLEYIQFSGAYGTITNSAKNEINEKGRKGFFFSRLTLPMSIMKNCYPILRKASWLYPVFWLWRLISRTFTSPRRVLFQLMAALGINKRVNENKGKTVG